MTPEIPYLAAGIVAVVGGARREGAFPKNGIRALIATAILVLIASATAGTKAAPLVRAVGLALLLAAVLAAGKTLPAAKKSGKG